MTNPDAVLTIGSRVHYSGDICNDGGWFEVTAIRHSRVIAGASYDLKEIGGCGRVLLGTRHIGTVYAGHCDPRFVTAEAVEAYRAATTEGRMAMKPSTPTEAGRKKTLTPCPWCRVEFGARDLRGHLPVCGKRKKKTERGMK